MAMEKTSYRGYTIRYHRTNKWFAHIYRPGSNKVANIVEATLKEGVEVLLQCARGWIDAQFT